MLLLLGLLLSSGALVSFTIKQHIEMTSLQENLASFTWWKLVRSCWFSWIIFLLQPMPFIVGYRVYYFVPPIQDYVFYHINDFLNMLSIVRLCYSIGKVIIFSSWMDHSAKRVCSLYGTDHNLLFAVKCVVRGQPITVAVVLLWLTIVVYANTVRICEAPLDRVARATLSHTYLNSIWEVILTTTTSSLLTSLSWVRRYLPEVYFWEDLHDFVCVQWCLCGFTHGSGRDQYIHF
jgi:hypothetical protein